MGKCLRVRVLINVSKPLLRGSKIDFDGVTSIVFFRYEKLGDFCFVCGKLDRIDRDCPTCLTSEATLVKEKRNFVSWLKADGLKAVIVEEL